MFTLTEVMIVVVIIGLVLALVGPNLINRFTQAKVRNAKNQMMLLKESVKTYYIDMSKYPETMDNLVTSPGDDKWSGPYLTDGVIPKDPWGNDFVYDKAAANGKPGFTCYGADGQAGGEGENADIFSWEKK